MAEASSQPTPPNSQQQRQDKRKMSSMERRRALTDWLFIGPQFFLFVALTIVTRIEA